MHKQCSNSTRYERLADALLGRCVRPFAAGSPPGFVGHHWYKWSHLGRHVDLLDRLVAQANASYIVELGSFLGDSAAAWARAIKRTRTDAVVVCMDTWLGDVNNWLWKRYWLGPQGPTGEPRIFEQFLANIVGDNLTDRVLPVRTSSTVGIRYLQRLLRQRLISRPSVIYLDAAHEYPETLHELELAWSLLRPGGILLGDDYDASWPGVVWSLNEFVASRRPADVAPVHYACGWAELLQPRRQNVSFPFLLTRGKLGNQWMVRKSSVKPSGQRGGQRAADIPAASHASNCFPPVEVSGWFPRRAQHVEPRQQQLHRKRERGTRQ